MNNILSKMNIGAHKHRPFTKENMELTLWRPSEEFMHCCIESSGCRFNRDKGACIMCDYGIGHKVSPIELEKALNNKLQPYLPSITTLLFGSYGSILDTEEVSEECFDIILNFVAKHKIQKVIFETHCCTVNKKNLARIKEKLFAANTKVIIEMGYESCDTYVIENCLNKILNLEQLCEAINLIHKYSMEASLNVFLGAPFLNEAEQLDTAVKSVNWAFEKGADSVVIFPCNIKPFTLLYQLYRNNDYRPVSQWMLVELLLRIPEEILNRITLSWYGDRKNFYENDEFPLIPPEDCEKCHRKILDFYHNFMREPDSKKRKQMVEKFAQIETDCNCHRKFLSQLGNQKRRLNGDEINYLLNKIQFDKGVGYGE